jgi:hypothetical protein
MSQTDNNNQNGGTAANMANPPTPQSVVLTVRIRKEIRDVAAPARQSSPSIPVAQPTTATAQVMVLVDHTTADIAPHPIAQAITVNPTFRQLTALLQVSYLRPQLVRIWQNQNILSRQLGDSI